jgi:hypothetical protein
LRKNRRGRRAPWFTAQQTMALGVDSAQATATVFDVSLITNSA